MDYAKPTIATLDLTIDGNACSTNPPEPPPTINLGGIATITDPTGGAASDIVNNAPIIGGLNAGEVIESGVDTINGLADYSDSAVPFVYSFIGAERDWDGNVCQWAVGNSPQYGAACNHPLFSP